LIHISFYTLKQTLHLIKQCVYSKRSFPDLNIDHIVKVKVYEQVNRTLLHFYKRMECCLYYCNACQ